MALIWDNLGQMADPAVAGGRWWFTDNLSGPFSAGFSVLAEAPPIPDPVAPEPPVTAPAAPVGPVDPAAGPDPGPVPVDPVAEVALPKLAVRLVSVVPPLPETSAVTITIDPIVPNVAWISYGTARLEDLEPPIKIDHITWSDAAGQTHPVASWEDLPPPADAPHVCEYILKPTIWPIYLFTFEATIDDDPASLSTFAARGGQRPNYNIGRDILRSRVAERI